MTKFLTKAALAATVALLATPAFAAPAGTSAFQTNAVIVKPVTMTNVDALDFGTTTMNPSLTSATVTVGDVSGAIAVCSSAMLSCSGGNPALFNLTSGVGGQTVLITFDTPPIELDHATISTAKVPFALNNPVENVVLTAAGTGSFRVGGQITVSSTTVDGAYDATVNVVANYL